MKPINELLKIQERIEFDESAHTYTDKETGEVYTPVSNVISLFKNDFPEKLMAQKTADKESVFQKRQVTQDEILELWKKKREDSCNWGTSVHKIVEFIIEKKTFIESDFNTNECTIHSHLEVYLNDLFKFNWMFSEQRLLNEEYSICGTADILEYIEETNTVNIYDIKTNDTIDKNAGYWKKENGKVVGFKKNYQKMCKPIENLEDCNFNHYQIQLSLYAFMLEAMGFNIGTLKLIHYDWKPDKKLNDYKVEVIECKYLKDEIISILEAKKNNDKFFSKPEDYRLGGLTQYLCSIEGGKEIIAKALNKDVMKQIQYAYGVPGKEDSDA